MLPETLQAALDQYLDGVPAKILQKRFEELSQIYRKGKASVFDDDAGCLAYLATRMPATYGAVDAVLNEMKLQMPDWQGKSLLDLGAGPATASWAALEHFPSIVRPVLWDQSRQVLEWGKKLAMHHPILRNAEWICQSLTDKTQLPKVDLVICSYSLTEMRNAISIIKKIWESEAPLMIVIEPGTPQGFENIRSIREEWLKLGGFLAAPCPHAFACPMTKGDWCHFSARIARTKLHRLLKGGGLGYEDEKFSYLIASRTSVQKVKNRIMRHPIKQKGYVQMVLCTKSGHLESRTISKSHSELYREARNAKWGDGFTYIETT